MILSQFEFDEHLLSISKVCIAYSASKNMDQEFLAYYPNSFISNLVKF